MTLGAESAVLSRPDDVEADGTHGHDDQCDEQLVQERRVERRHNERIAGLQRTTHAGHEALSLPGGATPTMQTSRPTLPLAVSEVAPAVAAHVYGEPATSHVEGVRRRAPASCVDGRAVADGPRGMSRGDRRDAHRPPSLSPSPTDPSVTRISADRTMAAITLSRWLGLGEWVRRWRNDGVEHAGQTYRRRLPGHGRAPVRRLQPHVH